MKKIIFVVMVIGILNSGVVHSSENPTMNIEQLENRKDSLCYAIDGEEPYTGKVIEMYETGEKCTEQFFKDGTFQNWSFWTQDGVQRETGTMTDQDGNVYKTIKIGENWWMAENLRVKHYRNGDEIPYVKKWNTWNNKRSDACCSYKHKKENFITYGYLYNWYAVDDERKIAPEGWHVPSDAEWAELIDHLGGEGQAGCRMNEAGTKHWTLMEWWKAPEDFPVNSSGFTALPGGQRHGMSFEDLGQDAFFWSATPEFRDESTFYSDAWYIYTNCGNCGVTRTRGDKRYGHSVRLIKD